MQRLEGKVDPDVLRFILSGGVSGGTGPRCPLPWLPEKAWSDLGCLSRLPPFPGLQDGFAKYSVRDF